MDENYKPLTEAEVKAIRDKSEAAFKELEHRQQVEKLENNHATTVGFLAFAIVILIGILLGTE
jgi:predicted N-acetyltransferase YhbS